MFTETSDAAAQVDSISVSIPKGQPNASWGLEQLAYFVQSSDGRADRISARFAKLSSQILRLHYDRGHALTIIRDEIFKDDGEGWKDWRQKNDCGGTTFNEDIRLYFSCSSWDEIASMGLTEAKVYLGIVKPKVKVRQADKPVATPPAPETPPTPPQQKQDSPEGAVTEGEVSPSMVQEEAVPLLDRLSVEEPPTGPSGSELLGQALSLLLAAERIGLDDSCMTLLSDISVTVERLRGNLDTGKGVVA